MRSIEKLKLSFSIERICTVPPKTFKNARPKWAELILLCKCLFFCDFRFFSIFFQIQLFAIVRDN